MPANRRRARPWLGPWIVIWTILLGTQLAAAVVPGTTPLWTSPLGLFVIVVIAATLCVVASVAVLIAAHRRELAELGLIGAFAFAVSALPLVHGLTVPGVLYGPNPATMSSVLWALPVASIAVLALVAPRNHWSLALTRRWRAYVAGYVTLVLALCIALLVRPTILPAPAMGAGSSIFVAIASVAVCFAMSMRHLRLSWISRSRKSVAVSLGFALVGVANLVWVGQAPFTLGFWLAHAFDILGVLLMTIAAIAAYGKARSVDSVLQPLVANEPLSAFSLGLDPIVHRFIASLEAKDEITRNHVVRTAATALTVGAYMRLRPRELHALGLGALLHDVGKLTIPDEILTKPGPLLPDEFEVMKGHTIAGQRLVSTSLALSEIGPIVRGHHERFDGTGYPDGLAGQAIPLAARIVSVCDAYDAMANARQYRAGMERDKAIGILRSYAGAQWDPSIVEALVAVLDRDTEISFAALNQVGRDELSAHAHAHACGCVDSLPREALSA